MKNRLPQTVGACGLVAIVLATTSITAGQVIDTLVKAKALYAEASYDEALAMLKDNQGAEAYQYRALCFLALGKTQDAEHAIESLINVAPTFAVSDADLPPRLVALFAQTRKRVMPGVVKRLFGEARADFQAHNLTSARDKFEKVQTLTHDPAMADSADAVDLQLLVASYIDILKNSAPTAPAPNPARTATTSAPAVPTPSTASAPAVTPAATAAAAAVPPVTPGPTATPSPVPSSATPPPAAASPKAEMARTEASPASPAAAAAAPVTTPAVAPRALVPAVTLRENFPTYEPLPGHPFSPMSGAIRITIGADGKVKAATMEIPIDPRYDVRVVNAAKAWLYKPATLGGEPIQSEKIVQINIAK
jgi:hypothetical protein